jgi:hypothetical protein
VGTIHLDQLFLVLGTFFVVLLVVAALIGDGG